MPFAKKRSAKKIDKASSKIIGSALDDMIAASQQHASEDTDSAEVIDIDPIEPSSTRGASSLSAKTHGSADAQSSAVLDENPKAKADAQPNAEQGTRTGEDAEFQTSQASPSVPENATESHKDTTASHLPSSTTQSASSEVAETGNPPTVIVFHASVGSGHRSAAEAVGEAFELLRDEGYGTMPPNLKVEVLDVLPFGKVVFDGDKTASLFTGFTRPIYDLTWRFTFTGHILWGGGTIWSRLMYSKFTDYVRKVKPLAIVATHITAANVAVGARMLSGQNFPVVCVPTDYETEGLWPHAKVDMFCVASESMAETLRPRKLPEERICITGIPTREAFRIQHDRQATRRKFSIPQNKFTILVLAGARLPQPYVHFRQTMDESLSYFKKLKKTQVVFVCGSNKAYAEHVREEVAKRKMRNVLVLEYVEDMAELMQACDLAVCKAGGLTVTECLNSQIPMLLVGHAYGQEKVNVNMLTSMGAAMHVTTTREFMIALGHIHEAPHLLKSMLVNASFLRMPDAARSIARHTWTLAQSPRPQNCDALMKKTFMKFYIGKAPAHLR